MGFRFSISRSARSHKTLHTLSVGLSPLGVVAKATGHAVPQGRRVGGEEGHGVPQRKPKSFAFVRERGTLVFVFASCPEVKRASTQDTSPHGCLRLSPGVAPRWRRLGPQESRKPTPAVRPMGRPHRRPPPNQRPPGPGRAGRPGQRGRGCAGSAHGERDGEEREGRGVGERGNAPHFEVWSCARGPRGAPSRASCRGACRLCIARHLLRTRRALGTTQFLCGGQGRVGETRARRQPALSRRALTLPSLPTPQPGRPPHTRTPPTLLQVKEHGVCVFWKRRETE